MIRIGLVGVGFMGWIHYLSYKKTKGVKLAAVCTRDECRLGDERGRRERTRRTLGLVHGEQGNRIWRRDEHHDHAASQFEVARSQSWTFQVVGHGDGQGRASAENAGENSRDPGFR